MIPAMPPFGWMGKIQKGWALAPPFFNGSGRLGRKTRRAQLRHNLSAQLRSSAERGVGHQLRCSGGREEPISTLPHGPDETLLLRCSSKNQVAIRCKCAQAGPRRNRPRHLFGHIVLIARQSFGQIHIMWPSIHGRAGGLLRQRYDQCACIGLGMLKTEVNVPGTKVQVEIFGSLYPAVVQEDAPLWDAKNERIRA